MPSPALMPKSRTLPAVPAKLPRSQVGTVAVVVVRRVAAVIVDDGNSVSGVVIPPPLREKVWRATFDHVVAVADRVASGAGEYVLVTTLDVNLRNRFHRSSFVHENVVVDMSRSDVRPDLYDVGRELLSSTWLDVATDASAGYTDRPAIAGIVEDGRYFACPTHAVSVLHAELLAMNKALHEFGNAVPLRVMSDSERGVELVECFLSRGYAPAHLSSRYASVVEAVASKLDRTGSTLVWVRGHDGNVLNEAADRLAKLSRRMGVTLGDVPHPVADRIVDEMIRALPARDTGGVLLARAS